MWLLVCLVILVMWLLYSLVRPLKYLGKRPRLKSIGITVFLFFAIALVNAAINPPKVEPVVLQPKTVKVPTTTTVVPPPAATFDVTKVANALKNEHIPGVRDLDIQLKDNYIVISATVSPTMSPDATVDLADTLVRRFASITHQYYSDYTMPDANSYGGIFEKYGAWVIIGSDANNVFIDRAVPAGSYLKFKDKRK